MESELLSIVSNQGLAMALSVFLVVWVCTKVSNVLEKIADSLNKQDGKIDKIIDKLDEK